MKLRSVPNAMETWRKAIYLGPSVGVLEQVYGSQDSPDASMDTDAKTAATLSFTWKRRDNMSDKRFRSRLVGGFGGAGGTLIGSPILQMLLGLDWPLELFLTSLMNIPPFLLSLFEHFLQRLAQLRHVCTHQFWKSRPYSRFLLRSE